MRYHFNILLFLTLLPEPTQAQEMKWQTISRISHDLQTVEIDLYRGSIELSASVDDSVRISFSVYDYDHYDSTNELKPFSGGRTKAKPEVDLVGSALNIKNELSREIIALKILIPKRLNVIININHLGLVTSSGIEGEQEVNLFSGEVKMGDLLNSALVHMVRDGDIYVSYQAIPQGIYSAFSTYDGDIHVNIPDRSAVGFDATTDLGQIRDDFDLDWMLKSPKQFNVKNTDGSIRQVTSYRQTARLGTKGANFMLKNIRGNINIKKRQ